MFPIYWNKQEKKKGIILILYISLSTMGNAIENLGKSMVHERSFPIPSLWL